MKEMRLIYCAAGFAEGTKGLWSRLRLPNDCGDLLLSSFFVLDQIGFLMENFLYMEAMANENHATDKFWLTVLASLNQLKGLAVGYL